jgi:hypothetical protein
VVPSKAVEGAKFTFGGINKKLKKFHSDAPGPGSYQPKHVKETSLSFSIGARLQSSIENSESKKIPGPGGYDPKYMFRSDGFFKLGKSKREGIYNDKLAA